jgi:hypothetical protein
MNCGLTNLDVLKRTLMAGTLAGETRFDLTLRMIGLGVRGAFEQICNRRLGYEVDDTVEFTGSRPHYYLPRFPVSGVTKVEMRYFQTDDWTVITGQPISVSYETGLVHFGYVLGRDPLRVRTTWSGGFWFETMEPDDDGYPSTKPEVTDPLALNNGGVVAVLPDELQAAFLWQCEALWAARDKLGMGLVDKPNEQSAMGKIEIAPLVRTILNQYIRYQIS